MPEAISIPLYFTSTTMLLPTTEIIAPRALLKVRSSVE